SENRPREHVPSNEEDIKEDMDQDGCIKLKGNKIPKVLVSLEDLFGKHDRFIKFEASQGTRQSAKYEK
ncbi:hypothetical protein KI387_003146, partial [Taxus chinensis]